MTNLKIVPKSVNSKVLYNEINDTIEEAITTLGVQWASESHRLSFIEIIEDYLMDLEDEGKIEQSKVICDNRNNKTFSKLATQYVFEVFYRQPTCLNVTSIGYYISTKKK